MPNRRKSMRQIREVLRLKFDHQLSSGQIAGSCGIGRSTVADYRERVEAAGLSWPLSEEWDNARLESLLFPDRRAAPRTSGTRPLPDFAAVHRELSSHQTWRGRPGSDRPTAGLCRRRPARPVVLGPLFRSTVGVWPTPRVSFSSRRLTSICRLAERDRRESALQPSRAGISLHPASNSVTGVGS